MLRPVIPKCPQTPFCVLNERKVKRIGGKTNKVKEEEEEKERKK